MEKEKIEKQSAESSAGLHQNLGLPTAISTVVGCVIGSGIFFKPQAIYTVTGGGSYLCGDCRFISGDRRNSNLSKPCLRA